MALVPKIAQPVTLPNFDDIASMLPGVVRIETASSSHLPFGHRREVLMVLMVRTAVVLIGGRLLQPTIGKCNQTNNKFPPWRTTGAVVIAQITRVICAQIATEGKAGKSHPALERCAASLSGSPDRHKGH